MSKVSVDAARDALEQVFKAGLRKAAAIGWDAALASLVHEDGTPVELVMVRNPYLERDEDENSE